MLRGQLNDILEGQVLGRPLAHIYTIGFQKRGLPHAHVLIILTDEFKPYEPSDYDRILCSEIPDTTSDSIFDLRQHRIVKHCVVHYMIQIKYSGVCLLASRFCRQKLANKATRSI